MWDIREAGLDVQPLFMNQTGHSAGVEDVAWSHYIPNRVGSVGDDSQLCLWDLRAKNQSKPVASRQNAHDGDINCLSFNPNHEFQLATGGTDGVVALWDVRNIKSSVHTLRGHRSGVFQVSWAPFDEGILASSGADRRLFVWDVRKAQQRKQQPEQHGAERVVGGKASRNVAAVVDEPAPELLFIHGGHTAKISDFSWCRAGGSKDWLVSSVSEDNILHVWQMVTSTV
jgi:histone-binding protein RBBP4